MSNRARQPSKALMKKLVEAVLDAPIEKTYIEILDDFGLKPSTVYNWRQRNPEFKEAMTAAQDERDKLREEAAIMIARTEEMTTATKVMKSSKGKSDSGMVAKQTYDNVARSRLKVETILKIVMRRQGALLRQKIDAEVSASVNTPEGTDELYKKIRAAYGGETD